MTRLSPLIFAILLAGCATPIPVALPDGSPQKALSAPLSASATQIGIQRVLDAQPRGDGIPHGIDPIGGAVHVAAGKLTYSKTIWLSSAQQLIGDSPGTTILDYQGQPGTPAIGIRSYVGNGYAVRPSVSHLSIHCAPGTRAIANDASAPTVHDAVLDDLIISGGGIRFTGECYFNLFRQINFEQPTSEPCILWEGQRLVLDSVRTAPNANVPAGSQAPSALIEVHGSVTVQGQSRFEGPVAAPYLKVTALKFPNGGVVRGVLTLIDGHYEPHRKGAWAVVDNCDIDAPWLPVIGAPDTPWVLTGGTTAYVKALDATTVKADAMSKVVVNGVATPVTAVEPQQ
jgi:hypothetical protein